MLMKTMTLKSWSRRAVVLTLVVFGFGFASAHEANAYYSVFYCNMARIGYPNKVPYSKFYRHGLVGYSNTTWNNCMSGIRRDVNDNKRGGTDIETFLIIQTSRKVINPVDRTATLQDVSSGKYGSWSGWIIYWCPARNRGHYTTQRFH